MTPAELRALHKRRAALDRGRDFKMAHAVAWLCEPHRNRESRPEPFRAEDVFPWLGEAPKERKPIDADTVRHKLRCLDALMRRRK